jgi:hypothetical protein
MTQHSQVRTDLLDKLNLSLNLYYYFLELSEPEVEVKPQMLRTEFAVKMSNILASQVFSQHDLTTVLNKEGFATMFDVTPDKFQSIYNP